jgi:hypothetical protein
MQKENIFQKEMPFPLPRAYPIDALHTNTQFCLNEWCFASMQRIMP